MKKIDIILTHFGDALCKKYIYVFIICDVQLGNGVHTP